MNRCPIDGQESDRGQLEFLTMSVSGQEMMHWSAAPETSSLVIPLTLLASHLPASPLIPVAVVGASLPPSFSSAAAEAEGEEKEEDERLMLLQPARLKQVIYVRMSINPTSCQSRRHRLRRRSWGGAKRRSGHASRQCGRMSIARQD